MPRLIALLPQVEGKGVQWETKHPLILVSLILIQKIEHTGMRGLSKKPDKRSSIFLLKNEAAIMREPQGITNKKVIDSSSQQA